MRNYLKILLKIVLLLGILLRLTIYAQQRSIVIDEASLIMNCVDRDFTQLWGQLDYGQYCPPFFSSIVKSLIIVGGDNELMVRLFPFFAGIIALLLFYRLTLRFLTPTSAVFALGIAAFSSIFIEYSVLCKQYSTDSMIALLLITMQLEQKDTKLDLKGVIVWILSGVVAIWISMPSVFTLAAIGIVNLFQHYRKYNTNWKPFFLKWVFIGVIWCINFALFYYLMLKEGIGNAQMIAFHKSYYLNLLPSNLTELSVLGNQLLALNGAVWGWSTIGLILPIIGLISLIIFRKKVENELLLLLGVPIILCLLASSIGMYSLIPRMTLFFQFNLLLLVFIGYNFLFLLEYKQKAVVVLKSAFMILLTLVILKEARLKNFYQPFKGEWSLIRGAMNFAEKHQNEYDAIWVKISSLNAFYYYTRRHEIANHYNIPVIPELWRCCSEDNVYQNIQLTKANFHKILVIEDGLNEKKLSSFITQNAGKSAIIYQDGGVQVHAINWE